MLWNLSEIYKALNLQKETKENPKFSGISIDTRKIKKTSFYIPIKGINFDGHNFIDNASDLGIKAALVERKKIHLVKCKRIHLVVVENTKKALVDLAVYSRKRNKKLTMICITGSSGKTTLKEWCKNILKIKFKIHYNEGNFNNEIGMPITLVNMPKATKICILELGMNKPGEIDFLSSVAMPQISIITNVGLAHIGNFRNEIDIAKEKSDIYKYLDISGTALIPGNSKFSKLMINKARAKTENIITFGSNISSDLSFSDCKNSKQIEFSIFKKKIKLKKKSYFNNWQINVLVILGLMKIFKVNLKDVKSKIENLRPLKGRGEISNLKIKDKKILLIDESYNSNPKSLERAIENLQYICRKHSRKILVIGDMLELGKMSSRLHEQIMKLIIQFYPDILITTGREFKKIDCQLPSNLKRYHIDNYMSIYKKLIKEINNGDVVMIKGSNSTNLFRVSNKLRENF